MKFHIVAFPGYFKEIEAASLDDVLSWINSRQIGKMDYSVFCGYPYTFENLVFQHIK